LFAQGTANTLEIKACESNYWQVLEMHDRNASSEFFPCNLTDDYVLHFLSLFLFNRLSLLGPVCSYNVYITCMHFIFAPLNVCKCLYTRWSGKRNEMLSNHPHNSWLKNYRYYELFLTLTWQCQVSKLVHNFKWNLNIV